MAKRLLLVLVLLAAAATAASAQSADGAGDAPQARPLITEDVEIIRPGTVRLQAGIAATPGSVGDYTWNGANGTLFWNDPAERLTVVVGTAAPGEIRKYYREQMGALVYGAMTRIHATR